MDIFTFTVAVILLVSPIFDWSATFILYRAYKEGKKVKHSSIALSERARMAAVLAVASTSNSILAANRLFELGIITSFSAIVLLSISLLLVSVPNVYWLWLYLKNRVR